MFGGSFRKPRHLGDRTIVAKVVADSYGDAKQQHTFTLQVLASSGTQPLDVGKKTRRKGRNVYRNGTTRSSWSNESDRVAACDEKHRRGDGARLARGLRKQIGL